MADNTQVLTTVKGGINRQRTKGAALKDSLFDLINGYVTEAKTVVVRPGTFRDHELPEGTHGLVSFLERLHVFAIEPVDAGDDIDVHVITHPDSTAEDPINIEPVDAGDDIDVHVITHPDSTAEDPINIETIEFAAPFLGFLYVVATFAPAGTDAAGDTYHFWLQTGDPWEAETVYDSGDVITPEVPTGFSYQATRLTAPNVSWAPSETREIGEVVEPTEYNGFYYTVVDVQGANPRSGLTEPEWPTEAGAQIIEDADGEPTTPASVTEPPDPSKFPSPSVVDRYGSGI